MKSKFDPQTFLKQVDNGKTTLTFLKKQILFSQGDAADAEKRLARLLLLMAHFGKEGKSSPQHRPPRLGFPFCGFVDFDRGERGVAWHLHCAN